MRQDYNGILTLDVGLSSIRLLQYNNDSAEVDLVAISPLEHKYSHSTQYLESELLNVIESSNVSTRNVATCLSGQNTIAKKFKIDDKEKDVKEAIEWEISQHILGSLDEYKVDYQELSNEASPEGMTEYLVVCCRSEYVDRRIRTLKRVGLNPILMDVDLFAIQNAFEANYGGESSKLSALLFYDDPVVKAVLTRNNMILDYEILSNKELEGNARAAWVISELQKMASNQSNGQPALEGVWVGGEIGEDEGVVSGVRSCLPDLQVNILNPFNGVKIREDLLAQMQNYISLCSIAVGLIARQREE